LPHVASLHIHPVKSLHRLSPQTLTLDPWGPRNDRRWLITEPDGTFITQRTDPAMALIAATPDETGLTLSHPAHTPIHIPFPPHTIPAAPVRVWKDTIPAQHAGPEAATWLTTILGRPCHLSYMHTPQTARPRHYETHSFPASFADGFPILITTTASLADLNAKLETPVPMDRFRPNIVIENDIPWEEDTWHTLRIGPVELILVKPCSRCVMTTVDQTTGQSPNRKEPLQTLARFRRAPGGVMFGQNALVTIPGTLTIGDPVTLLATGPSNLT